jgi:Predicted transcriptional regulators
MEETTSNPASILRKARVAAGITQAALAAQAGCKQSAVSMFEAGKRDALSRDSIVKIAAILRVELPAEDGGAGGENAAAAPAPGRPECAPRLPFCPNFDCPTNFAYTSGASVFLFPTGLAGSGKHCLFCGEPLSCKCPCCGAPISRPGACCPDCGAALVEFPDGFSTAVAEWAQRHNEAATLVSSQQSGRRPF